jgi:hypothetical protein
MDTRYIEGDILNLGTPWPIYTLIFTPPEETRAPLSVGQLINPRLSMTLQSV